MFGLDNLSAAIVIIFFVGFILPFVINARLAASRGKSVALILLLTVIFSWIVTLILAFIPKEDRDKITDNSIDLVDRYGAENLQLCWSCLKKPRSDKLKCIYCGVTISPGAETETVQ